MWLASRRQRPVRLVDTTGLAVERDGQRWLGNFSWLLSLLALSRDIYHFRFEEEEEEAPFSLSSSWRLRGNWCW